MSRSTAWQLALRARRRAAGECVACQTPSALYRCPSCAADQAAEQLERYGRVHCIDGGRAVCGAPGHRDGSGDPTCRNCRRILAARSREAAT